MKSTTKMRMLLGIASIFVAAGSIEAADVKDLFTLPSQIYWQAIILQPGTYVFMLDRTNNEVGTVAIKQEAKTVAWVTVQVT